MPLAEALISQNISVNGATTSFEKVEVLRQKGINPFLMTLEGADNFPDFFDSDCLIVTVPPGKVTEYGKQLSAMMSMISQKTKVIYTSSTSVYPELNREVNESDASLDCKTRSGINLLEIEQLFPKENTTILRFAGLIGPGRHPGGFFRSKNQVSGGGAPVNMIHQADCIRLIQWILEKELWGQIFNACVPDHPAKQDYYPKMAAQIGLDPPVFSDAQTDWKIVSGKKLMETGFEFGKGIWEI